MVPEVGAHVADTEPAFAGLQVLWVVVGRLVEDIDLATQFGSHSRSESQSRTRPATDHRAQGRDVSSRLPAYLVQAQVSVPLGNSLSEAVRQRVQHAVVRVHGREPVLLQLVCNDTDQLLHPLVIVGPVTNNLERGSKRHTQ